MRALHALLLLAFAFPMARAAPSGSDAEEIEHLLSYLAISDCAFNRNGKWYPALQAAKHLRGKYDYLLAKDLLSSAESFIERAASRSSVSGKPYLVRCGAAGPIESGPWFRAELQRFRDRKLSPPGRAPPGDATVGVSPHFDRDRPSFPATRARAPSRFTSARWESTDRRRSWPAGRHVST
jgi:hypothetical protein